MRQSEEPSEFVLEPLLYESVIFLRPNDKNFSEYANWFPIRDKLKIFFGFSEINLFLQ